MAEQFILPDLGEGIHEAQIVNILVHEGDVIQEDQPLMEVETDKAAVEIPSPLAGKIVTIHVQAGQTVNVGDVMVTFGNDAEAAPAAPPKAPPRAAPPPRTAPPTAAAPAVRSAGAAHADAASPAKAGKPAKVAASPAVRRRAKELGIDLAAMQGTGPGGRVTQADLDGAASGQPPAPAAAQAAAAQSAPAVTMPADSELPDFSKWGPIRREPISQIRKTISNHMARSEAMNVHVMHHDLADVEMLENLRKDHNLRKQESDPKLTLLPFVIKAVHAAMRRYPMFNASFDHARNEIIYKDYFHYGIAVDTPRGLIVPVIRDVDRKSIRALASELIEIGEKTRESNFKIDELRGGSFTITNIGSLGGIVSTPIINYPEVAILGLGKAEMKAVVVNGEVVARYTLPLNLSFDHRATDGADAARFVGEIKSYLEVPGRLLLED
ncbi:MAG: 2-oxo acid dehydrogenase subunit E2 [Planctomycetes bacterium]|nr:2-oxo acid dehydrogenase subunit E2 [Planctomycetota bacterium]